MTNASMRRGPTLRSGAGSPSKPINTSSPLAVGACCVRVDSARPRTRSRWTTQASTSSSRGAAKARTKTLVGDQESVHGGAWPGKDMDP